LLGREDGHGDEREGSCSKKRKEKKKDFIKIKDLVVEKSEGI